MTNASPLTNSGSLPTTSPKVLVASDLDRTLIYSSAALALTMPDARAPRLLSVEVHESKPLSYMTETAAGLLAELGDVADFVPTTTRTRKQYQRIQLPGPAPKYAICANGGHLLVDGVTDPEWHAAVTERLARECAPSTRCASTWRPPPTRPGYASTASPRTSSSTSSSSANCSPRTG